MRVSDIDLQWPSFVEQVSLAVLSFRVAYPDLGVVSLAQAPSTAEVEFQASWGQAPLCSMRVQEGLPREAYAATLRQIGAALRKRERQHWCDENDAEHCWLALYGLTVWGTPAHPYPLLFGERLPQEVN